MRVELVVVCLMLCGNLSHAEEAPDPTQLKPAPEELPRLAPPLCDADPRCRLARFRAELAHRRRIEYLERVDVAAREMERRVQKAKPWRVRYPFEVDFVFISNADTFGALIAYAPEWWVKLEGYAGGFDSSSYNYDTGSDFSFHGFSGGLQARFIPLKFPLAPYTSIGWGYLSGRSSGYDNNSGYPFEGSSEAHLVTLGIGFELVVPYFHLALGYQFQEAFYAQSLVDNKHDPTMRAALKSDMANDRHGAVLEIGCAF